MYKIESNIIEFERLYHSGESQKIVYLKSGNIINDTSFQITISKHTDGSELSAKNEIYYFKKFAPKPDSTNRYVY